MIAPAEPPRDASGALRIAVVVDAWPVPSETFLRRDLEAWAAAGAVIAVFAARAVRAARGPAPDIPAFFSPPGRTALAHPLRGAGGLLRDALRDLRAFPGALRSATLAMRLAPAAERFAPDVVHAQFLYRPAEMARLLAARMGRPFTASAHARDVFAQPERHLARRAAPARVLTACNQRAGDALATALRARPAPPVHVVHHGVPPPPMTTVRPDPRHILALGRFVEKKGFAVLLEACARLRARGLEFRLTLAGDGPLAGALRAQVAARGLADCTALPGWLDAAAVHAAIGASLCVVAPSVEAADGDRDGIPNVLLEAMAAGRPVVATDASAAAEAVQDGVEGFIVPAGRADALADRLADLLGNSEAAARMGMAARERVRRAFDPRACAERMLAIFRQAGLQP